MRLQDVTPLTSNANILSMRQDTGRVDVGHGRFPYVAVGIAVVVMIGVIIAAAYASHTKFGAEVKPTLDVEAVVNDHLAKNSARFPKQKMYYNCASFTESMFSSDQNLAVAIEQGNWRPGVQAVPGPGNLEVLRAVKKGESPWQISSTAIPNASFDPSFIAADSPQHPCNVK